MVTGEIESMIKPGECQNIQEIRDSIDAIDQEIITLISHRAQYIHAAAKFKKDKSSVKADDRVKAMLKKRAEWAKEKGLNPDIIVKIYSELVQFFISEEMSQWEKEKKTT